MNTIDKLKNNEYDIFELMNILDDPNPIVLYNVFMCIANNRIKEKPLIDKLSSLSIKLNNEDKALGYYKTGHLAMSVLLKLGVDEDEVFPDGLSLFDREAVWKFYHDNSW